MGSRIEDRACIACGGPLIDLSAEMGLCSQCLKKVNQKGKHVVKNKGDGTRKRRRLHIPALKKV